jgi:hypothetical protein
MRAEAITDEDIVNGSVVSVAVDRLRVYEEPEPGPQVVFWRINGYRARLLIWTLDEWDKMDSPPPDAQYHPSGVWCALRMD